MIEFDLTLKRGNFNLRAALRSEAPVIGLFGPSGAGKSSLLGILSGRLRPTHGRIVIDGRCLLDTAAGLDVPAHERHIGMVFQDSRLFPHFSVRRNLRYGYDLLKAAERRFEFGQIVELLELGRLLENKPHQLSGGEQQRVALGRALLASPSLLLLDEPMASLDERLKSQILPFLRRVKDETQVPMIYVSHAINEVLDLTQQIAVIQDGAITAFGHFHEVLRDDRVLALAQSLGLDNVLNARILQHHPALGYSEASIEGFPLVLPLMDVPEGSVVSVVVPATNVALSRGPLQGISIQNQVPGTVTGIRTIGHRALVTVDTGVDIIAEISEKSVRDMGIALQQQVYCLFKTQAIRPLGRYDHTG